MKEDDPFENELPETEQILEEQHIADEQVADDERLRAAGLSVTIGELEVLRPPTTCEVGTTIRAAIEKMHTERLGFILVVDQERLVGVFTERDLLTTVAVGEHDLDTAPVDLVMTADPECVGEDYELVYAINMMSVGGYRHIPVVDDEGRPTHVVSARNVVEHFAAKFSKEVVNLPSDPAHAIPQTAEGG